MLKILMYVKPGAYLSDIRLLVKKVQEPMTFVTDIQPAPQKTWNTVYSLFPFNIFYLYEEQLHSISLEFSFCVPLKR